MNDKNNGKVVVLLYDIAIPGSGGATVPRGMRGVVEGTHKGANVRVRFDMTQGIPKAKYPVLTHLYLFHNQYVEVTS